MPQRGGHVLLVDDDKNFRRVTAYALEESGFEVSTAAQGAEALGVLSESSPDVILCDLNMPVMDGITFIKEVKKTDCKHVPVLVLTTESQPHMKTAGKDAGAAGWLVKPFREAQLLAVIKKFVRIHLNGLGKTDWLSQLDDIFVRLNNLRCINELAFKADAP